MPQIRAIIFDVDGLLLDTEDHYDTVMEEIAGSPVPPSLRIQMFGRKPEESAKLFVEGMNLALTPEMYLEQRKPGLQKLFPTSKLMPGAEKLITHFHANNIPLATATSSNRESFELKKTNHAQLFAKFKCTITSDQVHSGKPSPAIFLTAAACLNISPQNCLVFEDAPNGVEAALAGNMSVVAVPHKLVRDTLVRDANQIIHSLEEFDPTSWDLPSFS